MDANSRMYRPLFALLTGVGLTALAQPALASGFYIQEQSAKGAGRAYSGEIADTGVDSLWWNPAAIGGMTGGEVAVNATAIIPRARVANTGTLIVRPGQPPAAVGGTQETDNPIENGVVPTGAIAHALTPNIALGLVIAAPYNFTTKYAADSWARYSAQTTRLRTIDIQPGVAFHVDAPGGIGVNLGAAVNVEHSTASFGNALPNLLSSLPDGEQLLTGKGWDVGYTLGARLAAGKLSLGVSYKSSITHHLDGTIAVSGLLGPLAANNVTASTNASFRTPWQLGFGARYKLTDAITLNGEVIRFGWAKFDAIRLGAPVNAAIPENYRNTWNYAGGIDVAVAKDWTVRGGVQRDISPVRDNDRDARVPDSNRWVYAVGASHDIGRFSIDAAANYLTLATAAIDRVTAAYAGTAAQTPVLVNGQVSSPHVFIVSLGGRYRF